MTVNINTEPVPANGVTHLAGAPVEIVLTECESTDASSVGITSTSATEPLLAEAQRYLAKWQFRLRLIDWDIWIEIGDVAEQNWAAQSDKEWRTRRAHITFPANFIEKSRAGGEHIPGTSDAQIIEEAAIHELLHILEEPEGSHVNDEICWLAGDRTNGGIVGAELRNGWRDYREWWINHMVRTLIEAERTKGWS